MIHHIEDVFKTPYKLCYDALLKPLQILLDLSQLVCTIHQLLFKLVHLIFHFLQNVIGVRYVYPIGQQA